MHLRMDSLSIGECLLGSESKAKRKRRLLAAYRDKWVPLAMQTLPWWRWLVQLCAWMDLQRQARL